jgi:2-aminoethylphosphonate-pyruvate transaminase
MIRQAVIVAGGMGTRLKERTALIPKGFLEIDGVPIAERSVQKLFAAGIEEVIIGTGYHNEKYDELARKYPCIKTVKNERYADTGSMGTLACCAPLVHGDFLLLESDLIYDALGLSVLINETHKNAILASGPTLSGDEVYLEADADGFVVKNSKNPGDIKTLAGELTGINRLQKPILDKMTAFMEAHRQDMPGMEYEYAMSAVSASASRDSEKIFIRKVEHYLWREIDDENHLAMAAGKIYPLIKEAEDLRRIQKEAPTSAI